MRLTLALALAAVPLTVVAAPAPKPAPQVAAAPVAAWHFEDDLNGWTAAGQGTAEFSTDKPLAGAGSVRMEVKADGRELKLTSPEFAVKPWMIYRIARRWDSDLGVELRLAVEISAGEKWEAAALHYPSGQFGTLPDTVRARLVVTQLIPGQVLGRVAKLDEVVVSEFGPQVREKGFNRYWDGGFELAKYGLSFWANEPEKLELGTTNPAEGKSYVHMESSKATYFVLRDVLVEPYRLYRFRARVRGKGVVWPGMHQLAPSDWTSMRADTAVRVGWGSPKTPEIRLSEDLWQVAEFLVPCESDRIVWFQYILTCPAGNSLDVDAVEMKAIGDLNDP